MLCYTTIERTFLVAFLQSPPQAGRLLPLNGLLEILFAESEHVAESTDRNRVLFPFQVLYLTDTADVIVVNGQATVQDETGHTGTDGADYGRQSLNRLVLTVALHFITDGIADHRLALIHMGSLIGAGNDRRQGSGQKNNQSNKKLFHNQRVQLIRTHKDNKNKNFVISRTKINLL